MGNQLLHLLYLAYQIFLHLHLIYSHQFPVAVKAASVIEITTPSRLVNLFCCNGVINRCAVEVTLEIVTPHKHAETAAFPKDATLSPSPPHQPRGKVAGNIALPLLVQSWV